MADHSGLPLEDLLNAISSQLDRAQSALALKAQTTALTFAVKDLTLDLRAVIDIEDAALLVRPALPGEAGSSTLKLAFTTVTRPMLEEHAVEMQAEEPAIADAVDGLSAEEVRRLEWIGVRNLTELRRARAKGGNATIRRLSSLPAERLKQALSLANERRVRRVSLLPMDPDTVQPIDPATRLRLRVAGSNLARGGRAPVARINGRVAEVQTTPGDALILSAPDIPIAGALSLEWPDGERLEHDFNGAEETGT